MTVKTKVDGARKGWVPAVVAIIGLGGYLGLTSDQIADLQNYVPGVAAFVVILGQAFLSYNVPNKGPDAPKGDGGAA